MIVVLFPFLLCDTLILEFENKYEGQYFMSSSSTISIIDTPSDNIAGKIHALVGGQII